MQQRAVPDEIAAGEGQHVGAEEIAARVAAERLFLVIADRALRGPLVAVGRHHAVAVVVVQQDKLLGQGVVVGRDPPTVVAELRVAVALGKVAEDLVVGAIFLDDIDDVLDGGGLAGMLRHGHGFEAAVGLFQRQQRLRHPGIG